MSQYDFRFPVVLLQLDVHFASLIRVLSLFEITPVEVQIGVKVEEELLVVSENVEHLRILVCLVL